jgi:hypothetical protein
VFQTAVRAGVPIEVKSKSPDASGLPANSMDAVVLNSSPLRLLHITNCLFVGIFLVVEMQIAMPYMWVTECSNGLHLDLAGERVRNVRVV